MNHLEIDEGIDLIVAERPRDERSITDVNGSALPHQIR